MTRTARLDASAQGRSGGYFGLQESGPTTATAVRLAPRGETLEFCQGRTTPCSAARRMNSSGAPPSSVHFTVRSG